MGLPEQELLREERRLADTVRRVQRELDRVERVAGGRKEQLIGGKKELWDDLVYDTDDWFEAAVQLTQQAQELSQQARSYRLAQGRLERLDRALEQPYFARFDFRESAEGAAEPIYLGTGSIADEDTHEVLVYDWRAPVAGMYYDFGPGPASYRSPDGEVHGEMTLKRQFVIRGGKLLAAFDTGVTIGDEMLQRMLGQRADAKMKSIVTTIQREQNQVIRETERRYVFVQGAAGSGKTSAALQRVAFLLYKYRQAWDPEQLVLFSPNDIFGDYVSNVLPELGEDAVAQTTFYDYVWHRLRHVGDVEHPYDQLEALMTNQGGEGAAGLRREGIRAKSSLSFAERIDAYVKTLGESGVSFQPLMRGEKAVVDAAELERMFYVDFAAKRLPLRLASMKERLSERLTELERGRAVALYRKWIKEPKYLGTEQELKKLSLAKARKAYEPARERAASLGFVDWKETYLRMLRSFAARLGNNASHESVALGSVAKEAGSLEDGARWAVVADDTERRLRADGTLPYEDAVPMLYLLEALHGSSRMNRMRHVVIDEAQDYTPLQWAYLRRLFPNAGMTAVGDENQAIHGAAMESGHLGALPLFPEAESLAVHLRRSYRSTMQITRFAEALLQAAGTAEPFERDGALPELTLLAGEDAGTHAAAAAERIKELREEGAVTLAVIAKTAAEAREAHRLLGSFGVQAALLAKEDASFPGGIVVAPSYLAKGLEFDAVVVWDSGASVYGKEEDRKLLYTVCTRALHRLVLFARGDVSPFIAAVPEPLYAKRPQISPKFTISTHQ